MILSFCRSVIWGKPITPYQKTLNQMQLQPSFGAHAKHFNYMEVDDINYYHVPTPLTELLYKSGFEQGHLLDALFTVNTSKQFNFSIAYKGMRSLR